MFQSLRNFYDFLIFSPARVIAFLEINKITKLNIGGLVFYKKRRSIQGSFLVLIGNSIFRILDTKVYFLFGRDWINREMSIYRELYQENISIDDQKNIYMAERKGLLLADLLVSPIYSWEIKREAIGKAIAALQKLHQLTSHGDATGKNVAYDLECQIAQWFDFETVHDSDVNKKWRHVDDIRALLFSVAKYIDEQLLQEVLQLVIENYEGEYILNSLSEAIAEEKYGAIVYHMAQTKLSAKQYFRLKKILIKVLSSYQSNNLEKVA